MSYIITYSGRKFDYANIEGNDIYWKDITHALSNISRYCGQTIDTVSVGQHTLYVFNYVYQCKGLSQYFLEYILRHALLHDASEAYTSDIPGPAKDFIAGFRSFEKRIQDKILNKFKLEPLFDLESSILKDADKLALHTESRIKRSKHVERELNDLYRKYFPSVCI